MVSQLFKYSKLGLQAKNNIYTARSNSFVNFKEKPDALIGPAAAQSYDLPREMD